MTGPTPRTRVPAMGGDRFVGMIAVSLVAATVVLPWLLWNQWTFGSVMQVSAAALPELLRADFLAEHV